MLSKPYSTVGRNPSTRPTRAPWRSTARSSILLSETSIPASILPGAWRARRTLLCNHARDRGKIVQAGSCRGDQLAMFAAALGTIPHPSEGSRTYRCCRYRERKCLGLALCHCPPAQREWRRALGRPLWGDRYETGVSRLRTGRLGEEFGSSYSPCKGPPRSPEGGCSGASRHAYGT
jgi:hypothetical protein